MFLHQGNDILISSTDAVLDITNLEPISSVQISAHSIAALANTLTGKCITSTQCLLEVEVYEMVSIQNLQLVMLPMVNLIDEIEPAQVPLTLITLSHDAI